MTKRLLILTLTLALTLTSSLFLQPAPAEAQSICDGCYKCKFTFFIGWRCRPEFNEIARCGCNDTGGFCRLLGDYCEVITIIP